ncbi:hypothetical protein BJY00DRAFT_313659 [Aspergillus carlsbadensis]|nr:hypothetical protein BJY00DRAFT_313659 [Aspergillus carlsbadensis]
MSYGPDSFNTKTSRAMFITDYNNADADFATVSSKPKLGKHPNNSFQGHNIWLYSRNSQRWSSSLQSQGKPPPEAVNVDGVFGYKPIYGDDDEVIDCKTTYTCEYGKGFDELCDNQRWGIFKGWAGKRVWTKDPQARGGRSRHDTLKEFWSHDDYLKPIFKVLITSGTARCQIENSIPPQNQVHLMPGSDRVYHPISERTVMGDLRASVR